MSEQRKRRPLIAAGMLFGVGLGGFFDGIVFHQILQWHHMLTSAGYPPNSVENLKINTLWDGLFHLVTWLLTLAGLCALWWASQREDVVWSTCLLIGSLSNGWGLFNLIEGIIDHQLLQIHHVRPGPNELAWDVAYLAWGAIMLVGGWLLIRASPSTSAMPRSSSADRFSN